jgi:asparagine synthase (glutamine-hydrolysing)
MSCIAGIINLDGLTVDHALLERMTRVMEGRAPDETRVWCSGNVGFGHAMLQVSPESQIEHQPCSLDGEVWITADARIDGRTELVSQLRSAGETVRGDAPDAELILHSYRAFGESFLDHLIGDFAFTLWDGRSRRLLCARDHFGVRPFYYVNTANAFLFASDIDALLTHPAVSTSLDEEAIADFLMFGSYQAPESTIFRHIRCLPPATSAHLDRGGLVFQKYWKLSPGNEVRYRRSTDYVEHFIEVFGRAVGDRGRANPVALELSGGMDSTSIAATLSAGGLPTNRQVTAYTSTCQQLLPGDREGHYAGLVAQELSIPIHYREVDRYRLFERSGACELRTSQPMAHPNLAAHFDTFAQIKKTGAKVLLTGFGGDAVLAGSQSYYTSLLENRRYLKFLLEASRHILDQHSLAGLGLRSYLMPRKSSPEWTPSYPEWMDEDFEARTRAKERWAAGWRMLNGKSDAYHQLEQPWLGHTFPSIEAFKMPLLARHPFFDLRLVAFLMGLPNFMTSGKRVLREAMRGKLPESVRVRPKTGAAGDQIREKIKLGRHEFPLGSALTCHSQGFISPRRYASGLERYKAGAGVESTWSSVVMITPVALDSWLQSHFSPDGAYQVEGKGYGQKRSTCI